MTTDTFITISKRFCGPPTTGNGGYTGGLLAQFVDGPAQVTLRRPPALDRPLRLSHEEDGVALWDEDLLIAEAAPVEFRLDVPPPPSFAEAEAASRNYIGFTQHIFGSCFVCGTGREPGDGLRIFAGPAAGQDMVAAPWVPDESLAGDDDNVRPEFVWAALDCPGAFATKKQSENSVIVLGRFEVELSSPVRVGESCVVVGWPLGEDGRKAYAGTAVFGEDGRLCGSARATWIALSPAAA